MIDLTILTKRGITAETLRQNLQGDPKDLQHGSAKLGDPGYDPLTATQQDKRWALWNRIRSRVQEGMDRNFRDWKTYYALDQAWDTPFRQISPTLIASLIDSNPDEDTVYKQLQDWGLTSLIEQQKDPRTGADTGKKVFNLPIFFNVFVPLVRAYLTIRWAKLMNDRRLIPFLKYEPVKATTQLRVKCEALTDRVQGISTQYSYFDVLKQGVFKMLHYGECFMTPKEEWHSETQVKIADQEDVLMEKKKEDGTPVNAGDEIKVTTREGLRYQHWHPTRYFKDLAHGAYTYNSDSGCQFFGAWRVARYRDILTSGFWNTDKVSLGTADLLVNNRLFFTSVYSACTMKMGVAVPPAPAPAIDGAAPVYTAGVGTGQLDREKDLANQYYGTDHLDQGVLVTEYFEKLVPSENGLGDYDHPVWFRFVLAGDGCTIIYAAPLPYCPVLYAGYDADESRSRNASMSLEILPFQDQFTNVLNQIILTAKQNLANITMVDEDQIPEDTKKRIAGIGEGLYRFLNVFGYSGKKASRGQNKVSEAVQTFALPKGNTAELINVLKTILDVLERLLVMSSHEVAQAASHEQTREEVRNIAQSTSSRQTFTATPVDILCEAWKRQIYCGLMAYGDDDMYAHIPAETPLTKEQLNAMGFTFVDKDLNVRDKYHTARVKKQATAIDMWLFASTRDGEDRTNDAQVAIAMSQLMQPLLQIPGMVQALGADQLIDIANQIAQKAGVDRDFKLRNVGPNTTPEEQKAQAEQQLKQVVDQVMQQLQPELQPLLEATKKNSDDLKVLQQMVGMIVAPMMPPSGPPMPGTPPMMPPGREPGPPLTPQLPPVNQPMMANGA